MKIFVSYRHTGEDLDELRETLGALCGALDRSGHSYYCTFFRSEYFTESGYSYAQIVHHALRKMDDCDEVLMFVRSDDKSSGMLAELGYAIAKGKPISLAVKEGVGAEIFRGSARRVIEFGDLTELFEKLKEL